jgi:uncharacterized protein DUF6134
LPVNQHAHLGARPSPLRATIKPEQNYSVPPIRALRRDSDRNRFNCVYRANTKPPDASSLDRALHTGVGMRRLFPVLGALFICSVAVFPAAPNGRAAHGRLPVPGDMTLDFVVMRNGTQIGTSTVRLRRDVEETVAESVTHIQVKIAYVTVYRFDQRQTERWADGNLVALNSLTDDNGTTHKVTARRKENTLAVEADGKTSEVDPTLTPVSLWNAALVQKTMALNTRDGSVTPVSVVDHGEEQLVVDGRPTAAHHYSIKTSFPQDVWYDSENRLVKAELRGSDGSRIQYQLG